MTQFLSTTPSIRRQRRRDGAVYFQKLERKFKPASSIPDYRPPREDTSRNIPSHPMSFDPKATERRSMMERALRGDESKEVADEIIRKSKCLAPAYNKGAVQYVGSEDQAKTVGRK